MTEQPADFRHLPADVPAEDTVAFQLEDNRINGPEGGDVSVASVDGDGDGDGD
jgi:hypothetical protein